MPRSRVREQPTTQYQLVMLSAASLIVLAAFAMQVDAPDQVYFLGLADYPLPALCQSKRFFNLDCPGCGMTRSFIYLAHGDWESSLRMHRLGWVLAALIAVQIPYRIYRLFRPGQIEVPRAFATWCWCVLAIAFVANWMLRMMEL